VDRRRWTAALRADRDFLKIEGTGWTTKAFADVAMMTDDAPMGPEASGKTTVGQLSVDGFDGFFARHHVPIVRALSLALGDDHLGRDAAADRHRTRHAPRHAQEPNQPLRHPKPLLSFRTALVARSCPTRPSKNSSATSGCWPGTTAF
jgi:hypothetical protein